MINGHGNNLYEYADKIQLDFSSNIAFNNNSPEILAFLQGKLTTVTNYPDPSATTLTQKIAEHHQLPPQSVLVANGSAEAFYLIGHYLAGSKTAICIPAFAEYEDACRVHKHAINCIPLKEFTGYDFSSYQSVWLGNPNNPDGVITPPESILAQCLENTGTYFIVDQAYAQLTSQQGVNVLEKGFPDNLIVIHSLTKEFAIPGLRLGYITAHPSVIRDISGMRPPWSVNALALAAGEFIMDNYTRLLPSLSELIEESSFLQQEFSHIEDIEVTPSSCNFFLSRVKKGTAAALKQDLIHNYGILIRDASNFKGLDPSFFRVAARDRSRNNELIKATREILQGVATSL